MHFHQKVIYDVHGYFVKEGLKMMQELKFTKLKYYYILTCESKQKFWMYDTTQTLKARFIDSYLNLMYGLVYGYGN